MKAEQQQYRDVLPQGLTLHWYRIKSVLGRGSFGVTYLARDTNLDLLVAIKEYFPSEFASRKSGFTVHPTTGAQRELFQWGLDRFIKEARILAQFKHPNIVRVLSVFEENQTAYMVMEYERGTDLAGIYKKRTLGEDRLLNIFLPIMDGLKRVHQKGFIHRDIKPANIYLREDGSPVLIDFGSARQAGGKTKSLTSLVTYGYAPFEQYSEGDDRQGPWTDIYAIGACLYTGITGHHPEEAMARGSSLLADGTDPYEPLTGLKPPGYSLHFLHAIDQALSFRADDRPQNLAAWEDMLRGNKDTASAPLESPDLDATVDLRASPPPLASTDTAAPSRRLFVKPQNRRGRSYWTNLVVNYKWLLGGAVSLLVLIIILSWVLLRIWLHDPNTDLLIQAQRAAVQGRLMEPENNNALFFYRRILRRDPNNNAASDGLKKAVATLTSRIEQRIEQGKLDEATAMLQKLQSRAEVKLETLRRKISAAEKHRAQTAALLQQARSHMAAGRLIKPLDNNAMRAFKAVLERDPGNTEASQGLLDINKQMLDQVRRHLSEDQASQALEILAALAAMGQDSPALRQLKNQALQSQTQQQKQHDMMALLRKGDRALAAGRLTKPPGQNAIFYYRRLLAIDAGHAGARAGIEKIKNEFKTRFLRNLAEQKLQKAAALLAATRRAFPDSALADHMQSRLQAEQSSRKNDLKHIMNTLGKFKTAFRTRNTGLMDGISRYHRGRKKFVRDLFSQYANIHPVISDLTHDRDGRRAGAQVSLVNLVNLKGQTVMPGPWASFRVAVVRQKTGHWRVIW